MEKNQAGIVKILLVTNPDLETVSADGNTPLLKAVKNRNTEIVQMLLEKKAKVTATDKQADTPLHVAMRARSKAIVELLLRNPKHSQLLYKPNRCTAADGSHYTTAAVGAVFRLPQLLIIDPEVGVVITAFHLRLLTPC